jgi:hypothetical protein
MEHTKIVLPTELENFSDRRDAEPVIPELVAQLVNLSCGDLTACRIPYGDSIGLPGKDGIVESGAGFRQFVPAGLSYWEIGTGANARAKATSDYTKRTRRCPRADRANATFVFVTPRSIDWPEADQAKWLSRRRGHGWKAVKIIDGVQLSDWIREFPAVGRWLLQKIGLLRVGTGVRTPAEHWEELAKLTGSEDPPLPPQLFLVGREQGTQCLARLFKQETSQVILAAESENDVEDFIAAYLQSLDAETRRAYGGRCLFISEASAWETFCGLRVSHVLVASPRLDLADTNEQLHIAARNRGHSLVIPALGAAPSGAGQVVPILSPSRSAIEATLIDAGYPRERAAELASAGAQNLAALKRFLRGLGDLPPYANRADARVLAQAGLVGKWKGGNAADREALEILLGKSYGEWIEVARAESLRADTPLLQRNEAWKILSRGEAWIALGPRVSDDDVARLSEVAVRVLSEKDPMFELPKEERHAAAVYRKTMKHSRSLREGIAESLALLGARSSALTSTSLGRAEATAKRVVNELLGKADWLTWASLNSELPLLAEAAPDEFLECVETALAELQTSPFLSVFAQESSGFGGWNYVSGLLWALETLAWHPDYLGRVTLLLGDLASIDPGGNWANRPHNSLVDIYLPWYSQTLADLPKRQAALEALIREHPDVGWKLLLALLPTSHGTTSGTRKPAWRAFIPSGWKESTTYDDYWKQTKLYAEMCIRIATSDLSKLEQLVDRLDDLPEPAHSSVIAHLSSSEVLTLPELDRLRLWESLEDLATKHRKFSGAQWAMPEDRIERIEKVARLIAPKTPALANRRLFTEREFDLYDEKGNYEEQAKQLDKRRQAVLAQLLEEGGVIEVLRFAESVESPRKVGLALGALEKPEVDSFLLPSHLKELQAKLNQFVGSFVWRRFHFGKWSWADERLRGDWSADQKLEFLLLLPAEPETWRRAEALLQGDASKYWHRVQLNPYWLEVEGLLEAADKLVTHGQPASAIDCLYLLAQKKVRIPLQLASSAFRDAVREEQQRKLEQYHATEAIKWLQETEDLESDELFHIEWSYLALLDRLHGGEPKALESRLASSPAFFCEVLALVFRSDQDDKTEKKELTQEQQRVAQNAYRLLHRWQTIPGTSNDGSFDGQRFLEWLAEVKRATKESGHLRVAMNQIGQVLAFAPPDPSGLWIHESIAQALDAKDALDMRRGLASGLFNKRGVFAFSHGVEERKLAADYRAKALALGDRGFPRVADAVRVLAEGYESEADREAKRDILDD